MKLKTGAARRWAEDFTLPIEMRLLGLAVGKARPGGHCPFGRGEIQASLKRMNEGTGEVSTYSPQYLNRVLTHGKEAGLFAPASSLRCIVLPVDVLEITLNLPADPCPFHGHNRSWLGGEDGEWFDMSETRAPGGNSRLPGEGGRKLTVSVPAL